MQPPAKGKVPEVLRGRSGPPPSCSETDPSALSTMHRLVYLSFTLLAFLGPPVVGQEAQDRPRVGLVLGGGGARGFAHLGVLKVLHELRVPVDAVAGTSMGAVVGGMLAQGIPYPELEATFRAENWTDMFHDDPPRRELPMRRKRADREVRLNLEVGLGMDGVRLPPSFVTGAKLNNALRSHTYRARHIQRFDALPIPFRAVATDVEDGSMVVLSRGDLAEAIRASMAVPAAFSPQEIGGRRLVDGGLVRNVPVDVARAMGVDVLIVSDVSTRLEDAPEGRDALALASRLVTAVTAGSSREQIASLGPDDVYLQPELGEVQSASFAKLDEALAAGEVVARRAERELRTLSLDTEAYEALVRARGAALPAPERVILDRIEVDTTATVLSPQVITSLLDLEPGQPATLSDIRAALVRVLGYGGFQGAEYRLAREGAEEVLRVMPMDRPWGPLFMRAGLSLADRQRGAGGWALKAQIGWDRPSGRGGEAWLEAELGTRHGLRAWGHLPITPSELWFVTTEATLGRREIVPTGLFTLPLEADLTDRSFSAGLGLRLGTWGEVVAEATAGRFDLEIPAEVDGELPRARISERSVSVRVEGDRLDRVDFPSGGHRMRIEFRRGFAASGGSDAFEHLTLDGFAAGSVGHHTVTASLILGSGLGTDVPLHRALNLGGIHRLTAVPREEILGGYAGFAKGTWGYRIGAEAADSGRGGLFVGLSAEAGQAWLLADDVEVALEQLRWGGSVWVGSMTPLGPVLVALGFLDGQRPGWTVQIGAPY